MVTFGRRSTNKQADLGVSDSVLVSRRAGTLELTAHGVLITNTGSNPLLLEEGARAIRSSLQHGGAQLVLTGRARIGFAGTGDSFEVEVVAPDGSGEAPEPAPLDQVRPDATAEDGQPLIAEDSAYFHCLVALCEPSLRNPANAWIPSAQQVADRLWQCQLLPGPRSAQWVERRLDELAERLPIATTKPDPATQSVWDIGQERGYQRKLVKYAIEHDLVTLDVVKRLFG